MSRLKDMSQEEVTRRIKRVLHCINSYLNEYDFGGCAGCDDYQLCSEIRYAIKEHYHLSNNLRVIC